MALALVLIRFMKLSLVYQMAELNARKSGLKKGKIRVLPICSGGTS
jgi:hypothetical protein